MGCGAALARMVWDHEVGVSNHLTPTIDRSRKGTDNRCEITIPDALWSFSTPVSPARFVDKLCFLVYHTYKTLIGS
jgi:hypothetical protein